MSVNESTLDIKQIVKTLKKRKGLIGKIFFAIAGLAFLAYFFTR